MKIGNVEINSRLVLAPMAGVTDLAFRTVCRELSGCFTVSEMVSAKALCYGDKKTPSLLQLGEGEHPAAVQIFGSTNRKTIITGSRITAVKIRFFMVKRLQTGGYAGGIPQ